jgi:hypothetical protein
MSLIAAVLLLSMAQAGTQVRSHAPEGVEETYASRRVAVVIGIDDYEDPDLNDLHFAAKDARDVTAVLQDPAHGAFDRVTPLIGRGSRAELRKTLESATADIQADDTFLFYFAGHGTLDLEQDGTHLYFLSSDSILARAPDTGIALDEIERFLEGLPARRRVLVVDACWSGSGRSGLSQATRTILNYLRGSIPEPTIVESSRVDAQLFAAHHNQPAIEDPELQNGVYTHYFVEALWGAGDADGDGLVDATEAHEYARDLTIEHTGGLQIPWIRTTVIGRNAVFLAGDPARRTPAERALLSGMQDLPTNTRLIVDGRTRGGGPLEPGPHEFELTTNHGVIYAGRVRVEAGERLDVASLVREREHRLEIELGGSVVAGTNALPMAEAFVRGTWWPEDNRGGRSSLGVSASWGIGPIFRDWSFPTGDIQLRAGYSWGRRLLVGPVLGTGVLWRMPGDERQAGPLLSPGVRSSFTIGRVFASIEPDIRIFSLDGEFRFVPDAGLSVGVRL